MVRVVWIVTLALAAVTLAEAAGVQAQDKKAQPPKKDEKKDPKKATVPPEQKPKGKEKPKTDWASELGGKLAALEEKDDSRLVFTLQVTFKYPELNTDAQRQIAQHQQTLAQQQMQLLRAKNAQEQQNALKQIAGTLRQIEQSQAQLYRLKDFNFDVKCQAADNLRVRKFEPGQPVDPDTGEYLKVTKEWLADAKGKEGYPGYKADAKILRNGQIVNVYFWKDSQTPAMLLEKGKKDGMKAEDLQAELKNFRYHVIMVYIAGDSK